MDMLLRYALPERMTDDPNIWSKIAQGMDAYCYSVSCLMVPGTLDHFEGLDVLAENESAIAFAKAHTKGDILPSEKGNLGKSRFVYWVRLTSSGILKDNDWGAKSSAHSLSRWREFGAARVGAIRF